MGADQLKALAQLPADSDQERVAGIKLARKKYLENLYGNSSSELSQKYERLYQQAQETFHRTERVRDELEYGTRKAIQYLEENVRTQKQLVASRDGVIRDRDREIASLKKQLQIQGEQILQKEQDFKALLMQAQEKGKEKEKEKDKDLVLDENADTQDVRKAANDSNGSKENRDIPESVRKVRQKRSIWQKLFSEKGSAVDTRTFARKFLDNEKYSDEAKDYLLQCLEEGDTLSEMEGYAFPGISVERMKRLRKLKKEEGD